MIRRFDIYAIETNREKADLNDLNDLNEVNANDDRGPPRAQ